MVDTVATHFSDSHPDSGLLINDFLQAIDLLKYFIYYSGVFLIDAKESLGLYTKALA